MAVMDFVIVEVQVILFVTVGVFNLASDLIWNEASNCWWLKASLWSGVRKYPRITFCISCSRDKSSRFFKNPVYLSE